MRTNDDAPGNRSDVCPRFLPTGTLCRRRCMTPLIGLIRHGETGWNRSRRIQGQLDTLLSTRGMRQARTLASALRHMPVTAIYTSDLARARNSAIPLALQLGLPIRPDSALRERHFGRFQGLTTHEAQTRYPQQWQRHRTRDPEYDLDGGESLNGFMQRIDTTLRTLGEQHVAGLLLLVAHAGVIDMAQRLCHGLPLELPRDHPVAHCTPFWLRLDGSGWHEASPPLPGSRKMGAG